MARTTSGRRGTSPRTPKLGRNGRGTIEILPQPEQNKVLLVLGFIIRCRAEITVIVVTVIVFNQLRHLFEVYTLAARCGDGCAITVTSVITEIIGSTGLNAGTLATLSMVTATLVVFALPVSRRFTIRRVWCVITRHRVRSCFGKTRTMTHHGRMPFLWWSRPSPVGERIRVWLPAGLSVKDLERVMPELATACWARETRITPIRAQAALVVVDIVRRDPLGNSRPLIPTVIDGIDPHLDPDHDVDTGVPLPDRNHLPKPAWLPTEDELADTDPASTSKPTTSKPTTGKTGTGKPATATTTGTTGTTDKNGSEPVTGFGGVDVSDYV